MRIQDLHELPKVRDSWAYLYVDQCRIDKDQNAIAAHDEFGTTPIPCASIQLLMLGPGTTITQAAITTLADNGCLTVWCGEQGVRFYASGTGETRSAKNLLKQAYLCTHEDQRLQVVRKMYAMRFADTLESSLSLQQIRGMEGVRVRDAYSRWASISGVKWEGRSYDRGDWKSANPINRALSCANSCLYGLCHAAIVAMGYSPGLGFIHTGKQLSFVYDVADLYKVDITLPVAFMTVSKSESNLESNIRHLCRDQFHEAKLLSRVAKDLETLFVIDADESDGSDFDADPAKPGNLWNGGDNNEVEGGQMYEIEEKGDRNS